MLRLTERERISLLMMRGWGDRLRSYNDVRQLFGIKIQVSQNLRFIIQSDVSKKLVALKIVKTRKPAIATNPEKALDVLQSFVENPHISRTVSRRTAEEHQIDQKAMCKILKQNKFHPFKIHLVQELNDDFDRRLEFCKLMMERIDAEPEFLYNVGFSDKATFLLKRLCQSTQL